MPEDASAGPLMEREKIMRMPKYSLGGDISLTYDDKQTKGSGTTNHEHSFTQNYSLGFQSYVFTPKFMYYSINTGFNKANSKQSGADITAKTYGFNTTFFSYKPFTFSLWASRTDGKDYDSTNYGLSMAYTRKVRVPKRRAVAPPVVDSNKSNANANANANANTNANTNANINENDSDNDNENENNSNSNKKVVLKPIRAKGQGEGLFSSVVDTLPVASFFNIDRSTNNSRGVKSDWRNAALRFQGYNYNIKTDYYLNFDYNDWNRGGSSHKGHGSDLSTRTKMKWTFFQNFDNYFYYRKNDITAYNFSSSLTGSTKKWNYGIYAGYFRSSPGSARQYNINANMSNATPYLYKGVNLSYGLGIGFSRSSNSKNDYFGNGSISAFKRFGLNTDWSSSLGVTGGKLGTTFSFQTGIGYTFRPRKGHMVSIEIDPINNTLKTQTFKPQVPSGWDYVLRTGYTFGLTKNTGDRGASGTTAAGGAIRSQQKAVTTHRANLNLNVFLSGLTLASNAEYMYSPQINRTFKWDNTIYTTVIGKVGITLGTGFTMDMPEQGTKTKNFNVYNQISYRLSRVTMLNINSNYTKVTPGNNTTLQIAPSITWRWRLVFVDLEASLKKDKNSSGKTTEKKIMLKVTRPFRIL